MARSAFNFRLQTKNKRRGYDILDNSMGFACAES